MALHGFERRRVDGQADLGGQAGGTEHAQRVLVEAGVWIPDRAQEASVEVDLAPGGIKETGLRGVRRGPPGCRRRPTPGDGVDGEVAPSEVRERIVGEGHVVGTPMVGVPMVDAKGGHLNRNGRGQNQHRAEAVVVAATRKDTQQLVGGRVRGQVPVRGRAAEQPIADPASDEITGMAGTPQLFEHVERLGFDRERRRRPRNIVRPGWIRAQFRPRKR